jgi:hypothetical protein
MAREAPWVRRPLFRAAPVVGDLALPQPQRRRTTTSPRPGGAGGSGRGRRRGGTVRIMVLIPEPFLKLRCDQPSGATATSRGLRNVPYDGARLAARWPYRAAPSKGLPAAPPAGPPPLYAGPGVERSMAGLAPIRVGRSRTGVAEALPTAPVTTAPSDARRARCGMGTRSRGSSPCE